MISRNEFRRLSLSQLILSITLFSSLQCSQTSKFDDDFIDVGIRLNGDSSDYLIADLIATENNFDNGGYVSTFHTFTFTDISFTLDQRYRYVPFSNKFGKSSQIKTIRR